MKKKIIAIIYKATMTILPFVAIGVTVINANSTACWMNAQPEVPESLKTYRKF